jgi:phenylalanyl-tRNA synthetase beta chain
MLVSLNWLNERIDLSEKSAQELDDLLTFAGIEVEGVNTQGPATDLVVVAQVVSAEKHPNADRLKVCKVETGDGKPRQIVCGAQNYQAGDKVPCALPGAVMPAGFEIKVGKLRGVESTGMLCSASELGYTDEVDGLMILPNDAPVGKPLREELGSDTIFELEITPNRPDLLSHSGVARELAALTGKPWQAVKVQEVSAQAVDDIQLEAEQGCPFYSAVRIDGVTVGESPHWLKTKLEAIGLRPINNIVDVTNYVLHELGQPLHAFDAAKVKLPLHIRWAKQRESFLALDEETYELRTEDVVISDASGTALALGGVMGGLDSGTTESTTSVILESALFHTSSIRRTSRRLGLTSDSSYRFERGVDPAGVLPAACVAAALIADLAGGTIAAAIHTAGTLQTDPHQVTFDEVVLNRYSDGTIPWSEAQRILTSLGIRETAANTWSVPSYRADLQRSVDLVEEVVRVYGLDRIPSTHATTLVEPSAEDGDYDLEMKLKRQLAAHGFYEAQTIKLIGESQLIDALTLKPLQEGDVIRVARPLSEDHALLRPSLSCGLLATAAVNARQHAKALRFFEMGTVFRNSGGGKATDVESQQLGLLLSGPRQPRHWDSSDADACDLFDLKAVLQSLLPHGVVDFMGREREGFFLGCDLKLNGKNVGVITMLSPDRTRELDIETPVFLAELDLAKVLAELSTTRQIEELPQFPGSSRDMAIEAPVDLPNAEIEKSLQKINEPLLVDSFCFDVFTDPTGKKLAADKKSMAYSLTYRSEAATLTSEQVTTAHERILKLLTETLPITFR